MHGDSTWYMSERVSRGMDGVWGREGERMWHMVISTRVHRYASTNADALYNPHQAG